MPFKFSVSALSLFLLLFGLTVTADVTAQKGSVPEVAEFEIVVQKTTVGIKLQGISGTAWKELSFSVNDFQPEAVDEYGMTNLGEGSSMRQGALADFLIVVQKTPEGVILKGHEGTAWTSLTFSLQREQTRGFNGWGALK